MRAKQALVNADSFRRGQEFGNQIAHDLPVLAESFAKKKGWLN
jgi:hypothetical protein